MFLALCDVLFFVGLYAQSLRSKQLDFLFSNPSGESLNLAK